ncbi:hypothetical protein INR49_018227 [Caranx melampygus]|nr:hypothetical protein INR49_018227 [Caranx melampygus]
MNLELLCGGQTDGVRKHFIPLCTWLNLCAGVLTWMLLSPSPCQVFCGRYVNEHMVTHGAVSEHPMVLSFCDLSVWCYLCEAYVHNQILFEAKNAAHCAKFGEEIPPWC